MTETKWQALRQALANAGAEALLVSTPANVRYLSGFRTPEDGRVVVTAEGAVLFTDARYTVQANEESSIEVEVLPRDWLPGLKELLKGRTLALEADHVSLSLARKLKQALGQEPIATEGLVTTLRRVKTPQEVETLKQAATLTDQAYSHILGFIKPGQREVEVALELERFMRLNGAEAKSFEIIVASGPRGAMPHGVASEKVIQTGEMVTLDFGAKVDGYHADMTRTFGVGSVSDRARELYDATLRAQEAALAAVAAGRDGKEVDAVARDILTEAGLGEYFVHSLGHGVGLNIHEGPSLSQNVSETLEPGMTVTIEPGVYLPGEAGVRIEDLVVVRQDGAERLSMSAKAWLCI